MSEGNQHIVSFVKEVTKGETPANPRFQLLPDNRTTINLTKETLATERLSGNRFPSKSRTGARQVSGEIPADLSYGTYDSFIESALQGLFVEDVAGVDSVSIDIDDAGAVSFDEGDTYATANGVITFETVNAIEQKLVAVYNPTVGDSINYVFEGLDTLTIDSEEFVIASFTNIAKSAVAKAGNTRSTFSIVREFSDLESAEKFLLYTGCEVGTWAITAEANKIAKSTFTFMGLSMLDPSASAPVGATFKPSIDNEPFDTFNGEMKVDGNATCIVTSYNLTINNNLSTQFSVGCESARGTRAGQSVIEGSITVFFETIDLYQKFIDEAQLALELTLEDNLGNQMVISLPNLKITSGTNIDVSGDAEITLPISFTAHEDIDLASHISVKRIERTA